MGFPSLEFSKSCMMAEAKITALFNVNLNVCRENIWKMVIITEEDKDT